MSRRRRNEEPRTRAPEIILRALRKQDGQSVAMLADKVVAAGWSMRCGQRNIARMVEQGVIEQDGWVHARDPRRRGAMFALCWLPASDPKSSGTPAEGLLTDERIFDLVWEGLGDSGSTLPDLMKSTQLGRRTLRRVLDDFAAPMEREGLHPLWVRR